MKRMISPELFQIRGDNSFEENFREYIDSARSYQRNSEQSGEKCDSVTGLGRAISGNDVSSEDGLSIKDNIVCDDIQNPRGSPGNLSNQSSRRQGTTVAPKLDALTPVNKPKERNKSTCECGLMHPDEELRRRSTGSNPVSYEEKHYYVGSSIEVSDDRGNTARHGKYSLMYMYDDMYVMEAMQCCRYRMRRNALCDPFRLPLPQKTREKLEKENEKRKSSMTRKVSQFFTVRLDLNREEDLL